MIYVANCWAESSRGWAQAELGPELTPCLMMSICVCVCMCVCGGPAMASPFKAARIFWLSLFGQRPAHTFIIKRGSGRSWVTRKSNRIYKMCAYFMPHGDREGVVGREGATGGCRSSALPKRVVALIWGLLAKKLHGPLVSNSNSNNTGNNNSNNNLATVVGRQSNSHIHKKHLWCMKFCYRFRFAIFCWSPWRRLHCLLWCVRCICMCVCVSVCCCWHVFVCDTESCSVCERCENVT